MLRTQSAGDETLLVAFHDRVREAVVGRLDPETLCDYHLRLAETIEGLERGDPRRIALHYREAGRPAAAAEYSVRAARQAVEALAFDQAAGFFRNALELGTWSRDDERTLQTELGNALVNAGRGGDSAEAFLSAAEGASPGDSSELQRRAAEQLLRSGRIDDGTAVIRRVLADVGLKLARKPWHAIVSMLLHRALLKLRGLRFRERPEDEISTKTLLRIDCCWAVSAGLGIVSRWR